MTSPCESIIVHCPQCGLTYEDWWRPSVNLALDAFDADYLDEATSATCLRCRTKISLPVPHVGGSDRGKFRLRRK